MTIDRKIWWINRIPMPRRLRRYFLTKLVVARRANVTTHSVQVQMPKEWTRWK